MMDKITKDRSWLSFARILMEIEIGESLIEEIHFINEFGQVVDQAVEYDWLPVKCSVCHCFGHSDASCRKKVQVWKKKEAPPQPK